MQNNMQPIGKSAPRALRDARATPQAPRHAPPRDAPRATRPTPRAPRRAEKINKNSSSVAAFARNTKLARKAVTDKNKMKSVNNAKLLKQDIKNTITKTSLEAQIKRGQNFGL
jgi:hypothetical protein